MNASFFDQAREFREHAGDDEEDGLRLFSQLAHPDESEALLQQRALELSLRVVSRKRAE